MPSLESAAAPNPAAIPMGVDLADSFLEGHCRRCGGDARRGAWGGLLLGRGPHLRNAAIWALQRTGRNPLDCLVDLSSDELKLACLQDLDSGACFYISAADDGRINSDGQMLAGCRQGRPASSLREALAMPEAAFDVAAIRLHYIGWRRNKGVLHPVGHALVSVPPVRLVEGQSGAGRLEPRRVRLLGFKTLDSGLSMNLLCPEWHAGTAAAALAQAAGYRDPWQLETYLRAMVQLQRLATQGVECTLVDVMKLWRHPEELRERLMYLEDWATVLVADAQRAAPDQMHPGLSEIMQEIASVRHHFGAGRPGEAELAGMAESMEAAFGDVVDHPAWRRRFCTPSLRRLEEAASAGLVFSLDKYTCPPAVASLLRFGFREVDKGAAQKDGGRPLLALELAGQQAWRWGSGAEATADAPGDFPRVRLDYLRQSIGLIELTESVRWYNRSLAESILQAGDRWAELDRPPEAPGEARP